MARIGLIALVMVLAACAAPTPFTPGQKVPAPAGWVDYCTRHPNDYDCKGDNQ